MVYVIPLLMALIVQMDHKYVYFIISGHAAACQALTQALLLLQIIRPPLLRSEPLSSSVAAWPPSLPGRGGLRT